VGELFTLLSMTLFSVANVTIMRGFDGQSRSQGAFLSIVVTTVLSALLWLVIGLWHGFPAIDSTAVTWFALAGVSTMLIGRVFLYASIQNLGAVRGSAIKRLNPAFSVLLGVWLLNESIGGAVAVGMLLIFASFGVLIRHSLKTARADGPAAEPRNAFRSLMTLGYFYGPVSALAYASGYVMRKQGLETMPDAVFGTLVGAVTGATGFLVIALFNDRYRNDVQQTFFVFNPWLLVAGFASTFGQIFYFVALKYSTVSKIALIASMEVFVTMFLSYLVFRGNIVITRDVLMAGAMGVAGTVLLIAF
jgi:drug/metabolite transporter (DMT)-like permease